MLLGAPSGTSALGPADGLADPRRRTPIAIPSNALNPGRRSPSHFIPRVADRAIVEMFSGEAAQLLLELEREHSGRALTEQAALRILSQILQEKVDSAH